MPKPAATRSTTTAKVHAAERAKAGARTAQDAPTPRLKAAPKSTAATTARTITATKTAARKAQAARPAAAPPTSATVPSAAFTSIVAILEANPGIRVARMFGHHGLALDRRFFAFDHHGALVVRLPPARVIDLTAAGAGAPFDPGMGRPSRGWLSVPPGRADWQRLAEEALGYVGTLPPK